MTDLHTLLERLESAEGPDREIDTLVVLTLCEGATVGEYIKGEGDDIVFHAQDLGIPNKRECPNYTASLDAAIALGEKVLGWSWLIRTARGRFWVNVFQDKGVGDSSKDAFGATPALALLTAMVKALIAEEEK